MIYNIKYISAYEIDLDTVLETSQIVENRVTKEQKKHTITESHMMAFRSHRKYDSLFLKSFLVKPIRKHNLGYFHDIYTSLNDIYDALTSCMCLNDKIMKKIICQSISF